MTSLHAFRTSDRGTAAIEFAALASFLLALTATVFDVCSLTLAARDSARIAGQLALAAATTCADETCVSDLTTMAGRRSVNLIAAGSAAVVRSAEVTKDNGTLKILSGDQTIRSSSLDSAALSLRDGELGVLVEMEIAPMLVLLPFLGSSAGVAPDPMVRAAVAVRKSSVPVV